MIAWRLAELEAAKLRLAELEPIHFFLGLLKICGLEIGAKRCRSVFRNSDKPEHRSRRLRFRLILRPELQEGSPRE